METKDNEIYENENLPEKEETAQEPEEIEEKNPQAELYDELEEVRALFEETLKKESEHFSDEGELIQSLEDIEEDEEETEQEEEALKLCECCEEEKPESEFTDGRDYCNECYEAMKKYPIRKRGILTCLIMAVAFFAALYSSMTSVINLNNPQDMSFEYFFSGFEAYTENRIVSAVNGYSKYLTAVEGKNNISGIAVKHTIDCYDRMGAYTYAAELIENHYTDFELKLPWNAKYRKILESNELYNATYSKIQELITANASESGYDFESLIKETAALKDEADEKGNKLYADFIVDIYTFDFMTMADYTDEELFEFINEIDKKYGKDENSHITTLCRYAAITGRKDVADECFDRMMKTNSQNVDIYSAYFNYYRFLETPDTEKMKELTAEMAELCGTLANECGIYNMDYLYCQAITYLLTGEGSMALEAMDQLYSSVNYYGSYYSGTFTTSTVNLYALAALYNGDTETYEWAKSMMENAGHKLSSLVEKYKDGEITIAEALTDKGGDIA